MRIKKFLRKIYWHLPLPIRVKKAFRNLFPQNGDQVRPGSEASSEYIPRDLVNDDSAGAYAQQLLSLPTHRNSAYCEYQDYADATRNNEKQDNILLAAYYLTQYYPTEKNNLWWGKGTTEWNNVSKAVPQYIGHYQPRLPGELGFYDLRLQENMQRQVELALNYGIGAFAFYYYWFNGERALELPLNNFLQNPNLGIKFFICWCNEDWTKRYNGIDSEVLLSVGKTVDSYEAFIHDAIEVFKDTRYLKINNRYVLVVYRPSEVPDCRKTLQKWRDIVAEETGTGLYIMASQEANIDEDWTKYGFDAISQFQPGSGISKAQEITAAKQKIRRDFKGHIYSYQSCAEAAVKGYKNTQKIYPAVMPMWDNTARRNNLGNIFAGSTPTRYKQWLAEAIRYVHHNERLEKKLVFLNAWNEWAEGAYLEPDREYGYAYLEATYEALQEVNDN